MEIIEQRHRVKAAEKILGNHTKDVSIRTRILVGEADDHPSVQAAAFYEAFSAH